MKIKHVFVILLSVLVFSSIGFSIAAHAEDDDRDSGSISREDEEDREDEDDEDEEDSVVTESKPKETQTVKEVKPEMITQTIVGPSTTVIVNEVRTVELADSDQDGLPDDNDPHPTIPEIYFVKDDNTNGIVDSFER